MLCFLPEAHIYLLLRGHLQSEATRVQIAQSAKRDGCVCAAETEPTEVANDTQYLALKEATVPANQGLRVCATIHQLCV